MDKRQSKPIGFVSELDQFLAEFDRQHPQNSPTQIFERKKYAHVNRLRDQVVAEESIIASGDMSDKF